MIPAFDSRREYADASDFLQSFSLWSRAGKQASNGRRLAIEFSAIAVGWFQMQAYHFAG
jgi:hypothetical protein